MTNGRSRELHNNNLHDTDYRQGVAATGRLDS